MPPYLDVSGARSSGGGIGFTSTGLFDHLASLPFFGGGAGGNGNTGGGGSGNYPEGWSSLIGIVTAIVGNILISFALNIQRYAHIRLSREAADADADARAETKRRESRKSTESNGGVMGRGVSREGATAEDSLMIIAGQRTSNGEQAGDEQDEASETDMLLPLSVSRENRRRRSAQAEALKKNYLHSPYWWIGIILMTVGEAGNFLAYGFAPASIVSPLGVVALISNCIVAPIMLKEPFRTRDLFGVLTAVAGAVTVVLSANDNNPKLGPNELWHLITRWEFETYFGISVACVIGLMAASRKYGQKSIFIDLGLVGLLGMGIFEDARSLTANYATRRLHSPVYKRRGVLAFVQALAHSHFPDHVSPYIRPHFHRHPADQVHQSRATAVRLHTGYTYTVCHVHSFGYSW